MLSVWWELLIKDPNNLNVDSAISTNPSSRKIQRWLIVKEKTHNSDHLSTVTGVWMGSVATPTILASPFTSDFDLFASIKTLYVV